MAAALIVNVSSAYAEKCKAHSPPDGVQILDNAGLKSKIVGNDVDAGRYEMTYHTDGSLTSSTRDSTGTWKICGPIMIHLWPNGYVAERLMALDGDDVTYFYLSGKERSKVKLVVKK